MQSLEQLRQHLTNLRNQGKKSVTLDVNWLLEQLEPNKTQANKPTSPYYDGGKF